MTAPLMSIVTATYDRAPMLVAAIDSVLAQVDPAPWWEHVVVDGASTDDTLERLVRYPHLRVMSEPDTGVYDAMNKGLRLARGRMVLLLNSDDALPPGTLQAVRDAAVDGVQIVSGAARVVRPDGTEVATHRPAGPLELHELTRGVAITNARIIDRELLLRVGGFDASYRMAADRLMLIRLWQQDPRGVVLDRVVYDYTEHEGSLTVRGAETDTVQAEYRRVIDELRGTGSATLERELRAWAAQLTAREVRHLFTLGRPATALARAVGAAARDPLWPVRVRSKPAAGRG